MSLKETLTLRTTDTRLTREYVHEKGGSTSPVLSDASTVVDSPSTLSVKSLPCTLNTSIGEPSSTGISTTRLFFAHLGAAMTLFLATTDATVVSTSLPTIVSELNGSQNQYTWVGVSYMLTQTAFQPLYGVFSNIIGRTAVLYISMVIFAIGSILCGSAKSIEWLISMRALAGIGGGGIANAVWVLTAELVPIESRAIWSQALSLTWSCSAIAGPLLGGAFSGVSGQGLLSWRWAFYLNVPVCLLAFSILKISLYGVHLAKHEEPSWRAALARFDFGGLLLFVAGSSSIILGFSFVTDYGWSSASTLVPIILGPAILVAGAFYEIIFSPAGCLFPPSVFKDLMAVVSLVITFLHNVAFTAGTFYLALYYQAATGCTPLEAGIKVLPYSLGSSLASMPAAWFINFWQRRTSNTSGQNMIISLGLLVSALGFGLLVLLDASASHVRQVIFPLIAGIGIGMLFHAPYQVFTKALKPNELATGTSAFFLVRFTGATVGLAVAGTIFNSRVAALLPAHLAAISKGSAIDYSLIRTLEPQSLQEHILGGFSNSIQAVWLFCSPCLGLAFLFSLLLKKLPIETSSPEATPNSSKSTDDPLTEKV